MDAFDQIATISEPQQVQSPQLKVGGDAFDEHMNNLAIQKMSTNFAPGPQDPNSFNQPENALVHARRNRQQELIQQDAAATRANQQTSDAAYASAHPIANAIDSAREAIGGGEMKSMAAVANFLSGQKMGSFGPTTQQHLNPQQMTNVNQGINAAAGSLYGNPAVNTPTGQFGTQAGQLIHMMAGGVGAPLVAAQYAGTGAEENIAARQAAGKDISGLQEAGNVLGQGLVAGGTAALLPGGKLAGSIGDALLPAGSNLAERIAARGGLGYLGTQADMALQQVGGNLVNAATVPDANQDMLSGVPEALSITNPINAIGGLTGVLHGLAPVPHPPAYGEPIPPETVMRPPTPEQLAAEPKQYTPEQAQQYEKTREEERHVEGYNERLNAVGREVKAGEEKAPEPEFPAGEHHFEEGRTEETPEIAALQKRLAEADLSDQRKEPNTPPANPEDERRFDELTKGAQFLPPEETSQGVNAIPTNALADAAARESYKLTDPEAYAKAQAEVNALRSQPHALEQAAGNQAVREEYGEPPQPGFLSKLSSKLGELATSESGSLHGVGEFARQEVLPALDEAFAGVKKSLTDIDRTRNIGFTDTEKGEQTRLDLAKTLGDAKVAGHAYDAAAKPFKDFAKTLTPAQEDDWLDQFNQSGTSAFPELAGLADLTRRTSEQNAVRGRKLGLKNLDELGFNTAQTWEFPDEYGRYPSEGGKKSSGQGGGSIAETNAPFYRRSYATAADARRAAELVGGRRRGGDLASANIIRQYAVESNLATREQIRADEKAGNLEWVKAGDKSAPGNDTPLADPLIGTETRRPSLPSWMAGTFSKLEGYEASRYLEENADKIKYVRPGEDPEQGYSYVPGEQQGTFHTNPDQARAYNELLGAGKNGPLMDAAQKIARASLTMRYLWGPAHLAGAGVVNGVWHATEAIKGAVGFSDTPVFQSISDALMIPAIRKGLEQIHSVEGGTPDEATRRVMEANPGVKFQRSIDKTAYERAMAKYDAGNPLGGTMTLLNHYIQKMGDVTYNKGISPMIFNALHSLASADIAEGRPAEAGQAKLAEVNRNLSRMMGNHINSESFKSGVGRDIANLVFPAYDLMEGITRTTASAGRSILPKAVGGKRDTSALALIGGGLVLQALANAAFQMTATAAHGKMILPTSIADLAHPQIGTTDDNGNPTRITPPGPYSWLMRMATHPLDELYARLNPIIPGAIETYRNKDFYGNQVRPTGGNPVANFARGVGHTVKGLAPLVGQSAYSTMDENQPGTTTEKVAKAAAQTFGFSVSHPVTSSARQILYDALNQSEPAGRTPEQESLRNRTKDYIKRLRANPDDQSVYDDMDKDESLSSARKQDILKSAEKPKGLGGLVSDSQIPLASLHDAWEAATDDEKSEMRDGLLSRLDRMHYNDLAHANQIVYDKLYSEVGAK